MNRRFKDHFSGHASDYSRFRPVYPPALFAHLAAEAPRRCLAWDCATGNGQAAVALAGLFTSVVATDASEKQISQTPRVDNICFSVAAAEQPPLAAASIDLVTVAQALHWFDIPAFYAAAQAVLRPGGVIAVWSYNFLQVNDAVDAPVLDLYRDLVGPYWPPERALVEGGYQDIDFPFAPMQTPSFSMAADWSLEQLLGYLGTWSAVRRYRETKGEDPVAHIAPAVSQAWGKDGYRRVTWPLSLKVGRAC